MPVPSTPSSSAGVPLTVKSLGWTLDGSTKAPMFTTKSVTWVKTVLLQAGWVPMTVHCASLADGDALGVVVAVGVAVAVGVGVGVGVEEPDCAKYFAPVLKTLTLLYPPQTIISPPVQTPTCQKRAAGAPLVLVAVQLSVPGLYLPPVFNELAF